MNENQKPSTKDPWSAYLLGTLAVVIFGATLPVTRLALNDFDPWFLTFARAAIATILAAVCLRLFGTVPSRSSKAETFVAGVLLIYGFPAFMAVAMQSVPAAHGGVILGFLPLATAMISRLLTGEKPSPKFWILSIAGFVIVAAFILFQADDTGVAGVSTGDVWLILAGLSASTGYVIFGKLSRTIPGWIVISRALILNTPITLLGVILLFDASTLQVSSKGLASLLYLGAFSMFLGFCAWNFALAKGGIARIGQLQLLQIFATIATTALLLDETIDALTVSAALLITAMIALSRRG